ncbi:hypothetical protein DEIPH_ctg033orf0073 [Deinococcus phoenicis]|uniref:Uncharacterized protein n=1 Tax=Deinococcus phoenicis TaxID=1476583 RepID=A0A016QND7_9DEIO|nr:tetratricopeptide repeat protein [Deinococcus phoenicis]EYB67655.1 hypothetical protein DEIPH_ctg033orf0073 [Deinococcus phoenicis]
MTDPGRSPSPPLDAPPDWGTFARDGEWRRALAAARITVAPAELREALERVVDLQGAVRARRFPQARRAWTGLQEALEAAQGQGLTGEAALLRSLVRPDALGEALAVLEGLGRGPGGETEPDALRERLAPAFAHPLTRAEALNAVGVLHALHGEAELARAVFGEALAADPSHYRAVTNIGNLELEAGHPAQAETRYREVLRLNPDYDGAHHNLGVALRRQGKLHESVGSIRRAQRLGVKRSQEDSREDLREQFRGNTTFRSLRWVLLAAGLLVLFLIVRGLVG